MGIGNFASRHTGQDFSATGVGGALSVAAGEPVQVVGIHFYALANTIFTVTDASDVALFRVGVEAFNSYNIQTNWIADAGIKVQSNDATAACMVFHNSPGNK